MKKLTVGTIFAGVTCVLTAVTLIILLVYASKGGIVSGAVYAAIICALVCEAAAFLGEKTWTDYVGIIGAALLAYTMMTVLSDGIWNIAESISGIKMVGIPEIAGMNYTLVAVNLAAIVTGIVACFCKKSK